jgi:hypothetical protein
MSLGKTSALIVALVAAMALGVWIGPSVTDRFDRATPTVSDETAAPAEAPARAEPVARPRPARAARASKPAARVASAAETPEPAAVDLGAPELQKRLKSVLNRGADVSIASSGFRSAEQFATVAHAARNTGIPFMLLKHRVLTEGKTLGQAIRESRPEADVAAEVKAAQSSARRDIASIAG